MSYCWKCRATAKNSKVATNICLSFSHHILTAPKSSLACPESLFQGKIICYVLARLAGASGSPCKMEIPALFHMAVPDCLAISALLLLPFAFIYLGTLSKMIMTYHAKRPGVNPPVAPYWIPWIAHSLRFFMSPAQLAISIQ